MEESEDNKYKKVLKVYDIFKEFFGERNTDLQYPNVLSPFILVHFPRVKVTNEYNKSIDIDHLFAKICISLDGKMVGGFTLNRSEYTSTQFSSNYMHSHICNIPVNDFEEFQPPCLGTGPIRNTIASLNVEYDESLWNLFCLELSKYVTVESISGVPYHRLEQIGSDRNYCRIPFYKIISSNIQLFPEELQCIASKFIRYYIDNNNLRFNYINGSYSIAMPMVAYILNISNSFIHWYNKIYSPNADNVYSVWSLSHEIGILKKCMIKNNDIYVKYCNDSVRPENFERYIGSKICTFKGKDVLLNIKIEHSTEENDVYLLNIDLAFAILYRMLEIINFNYGKEESNGTDDISRKKIEYL